MRPLSLVLLGAATLLGTATLPAQAPAGGQPQPGAQAGPQGQRGRDGRLDGRRGLRDGPGRDRVAGRAALRGITLSDAQRTQLRAVAERYRTQRRALHDEARAQFGRGTDAQPGAQRARPDSATRAAFRTRVRDLQQRQLADVRAVLTPEQRTTFDRNVAELRTRAQARGARGDRSAR